MSEAIDLVELADELARIAHTTRDPATGARLMAIVGHLLAQAGLPPHEGGGGEPPPWVSEPICEPA